MLIHGNNGIDDREAPLRNERELDRDIDIGGRVQINDWLGKTQWPRLKIDGVPIFDVVRSNTPIIAHYRSIPDCLDIGGTTSQYITSLGKEFVHPYRPRDVGRPDLARWKNDFDRDFVIVLSAVVCLDFSTENTCRIFGVRTSCFVCEPDLAPIGCQAMEQATEYRAVVEWAMLFVHGLPRLR